MKKCPTCQGVYDDAKSFCPKCGIALTDAAETQTAVPTANNTTTPAKTGNGFWEKWGGILLAVLGFLICWEIFAILGCAIAIVAAIYAWKSDNPINKFGALIIAVISAILTIGTMI